MGPTCEVVFELPLPDASLDALSSYIREVATDSLGRKAAGTRKGRSWDVWIDDRPISISTETNEAPNSILFAAGCNSLEDYSILRRVVREVAQLLGGVATEPIK